MPGVRTTQVVITKQICVRGWEGLVVSRTQVLQLSRSIIVETVVQEDRTEFIVAMLPCMHFYCITVTKQRVGLEKMFDN